MRACWSLFAAVAIPVWLAACASGPPKSEGALDLATGLDASPTPGNQTPSRPQPSALSAPPAGSIGSSIGAPTPGRVGSGIGN